MDSKERIESLKLKLNQLKSLTKINTHLETIKYKLNNNSSDDLCLALNLCKISEKQTISSNAKKSNPPREIFKCSWNNCQYISASKHNLYWHKTGHFNEGLFVCDFVDCNKKFNYKRYLDQHKRTHFDKKLFKCDFNDCNKEFKSRSGSYHHKKTHSDQKPIKCDFIGCNKVFKSKPSLNNHNRTHFLEKRFKCDFEDCNKRI